MRIERDSGPVPCGRFEHMHIWIHGNMHSEEAEDLRRYFPLPINDPRKSFCFVCIYMRVVLQT